GYGALALTDHDGVYGSLEFVQAAQAFGVRPITGAEVTLADGSHVTLLVESAAGYANLCRLLTAAHSGTRVPGKERELLEPALRQELLEERNDGLVCLSGCARHGLAVRNPNATARLAQAFGHDRDAVERTGELAERLQFDLNEDLGYRYPDFSENGEPAIAQLKSVCDRAFAERYSKNNDHKRKARARLDEELKLIDELGLAG